MNAKFVTPVFVVCSLFALAGCINNGSSLDPIFSEPLASGSSPTSLIPQDSGAVNTSQLPPVDGSVPPTDGGSNPQDIPQDGQIAIADGVGANGSIVDIDQQNNPYQVATRTISNPAQKQQLIGGWSIQAGDATCRLFLTLTAKSGNYRASTPGCEAPALKSVGSWSFDNGKVVLFNRSGNQVATFMQSGNRFVGSLFDGTGASLAG